jgi:hypothetical protein
MTRKADALTTSQLRRYVDGVFVEFPDIDVTTDRRVRVGDGTLYGTKLGMICGKRRPYLLTKIRITNVGNGYRARATASAITSYDGITSADFRARFPREERMKHYQVIQRDQEYYFTDDYDTGNPPILFEPLPTSTYLWEKDCFLYVEEFKTISLSDHCKLLGKADKGCVRMVRSAINDLNANTDVEDDDPEGSEDIENSQESMEVSEQGVTDTYVEQDGFEGSEVDGTLTAQEGFSEPDSDYECEDDYHNAEAFETSSASIVKGDETALTSVSAIYQELDWEASQNTDSDIISDAAGYRNATALSPEHIERLRDFLNLIDSGEAIRDFVGPTVEWKLMIGANSYTVESFDPLGLSKLAAILGSVQRQEELKWRIQETSNYGFTYIPPFSDVDFEDATQFSKLHPDTPTVVQKYPFDARDLSSLPVTKVLVEAKKKVIDLDAPLGEHIPIYMLKNPSAKRLIEAIFGLPNTMSTFLMETPLKRKFSRSTPFQKVLHLTMSVNMAILETTRRKFPLATNARTPGPASAPQAVKLPSVTCLFRF